MGGSFALTRQIPSLHAPTLGPSGPAPCRGLNADPRLPSPLQVVLPHQPLATYTAVGKSSPRPWPPPGPSSERHPELCDLLLPTGPSCLDMDASAPMVTEEGALCASWLSQPAPATLQPLAPWPPYTEYVSHEAVSCPYSGDMYVQPVCPSYTVVGPSSVLTYASQPLITNVTVRHAEAQRPPHAEGTLEDLLASDLPCCGFPG